MSNTKRCLLLALLAAGILQSNAQTADSCFLKSGLKTFGFAINFQVGYRDSHIDRLNSKVVPPGLPVLPKNDIWYNISLTHQFDQVMTELGFGLTAPSQADAGNLKVSYYQDQVFLRVGYNISAIPDHRLYPFVGANFSRASLKIRDESSIERVNRFADELRNQPVDKTLCQRNFGIDLGVGYDYQITLRSKKMPGYTVRGTLPVGFRAGYYIQTSAGAWRTGDHILIDGPDQKASSFFATLSVGLGFAARK